MTDLVVTGKNSKGQVTLSALQDLLDAREEAAEARGVVSTKKAQVEQAKREFALDPLATVEDMHALVTKLCSIFGDEIDRDSVPLRQIEIDTLSEEFKLVEEIKAKLEALEGRYKELIFAHLDETGPRIPGRPACQVPGKVEASGPDDHYVFERRGGNRADPDLNTDGLREVLPAHLNAKIFATVVHPAVEAYEEEVFDEVEFGKLVEAGQIDLDTVAKYLTPGPWRKPSFWKTRVGRKK